MSGETLITVVGNLTADPELRFTQSGVAVASFTVASTPRTFDRQANEWKDGQALFLRCTVWREVGENVAESLSKGMRVIVQGNLKQRSWETETGERRTSVELDVVEVGPSLFRASARVTRNQRASDGGGYGAQQGLQQGQYGPQGQQGAQAQQGAQQAQYAPQDDPWAARQPASDQPPF